MKITKRVLAFITAIGSGIIMSFGGVNAIENNELPIVPLDPVEGVVGDANGDGVMNVRDCAYIASMLAKGMADELPTVADFNGDGAVNVRDAAAIASSLASGK